MPSLRYRMLEKMFSLIGVNKMLDKEGEEWEKLLAHNGCAVLPK